MTRHKSFISTYILKKCMSCQQIIYFLKSKIMNGQFFHSNSNKSQLKIFLICQIENTLTYRQTLVEIRPHKLNSIGRIMGGHKAKPRERNPFSLSFTSLHILLPQTCILLAFHCFASVSKATCIGVIHIYVKIFLFLCTYFF